MATLAAQDADPSTFVLGKQLAIFEPTMAFAPGGAAWVSAPACPASEGSCAAHPSHAWRVANGSIVARAPNATKGVAGNGDSAVWVAADGQVFLVDQGGGESLYRSSDEGRSWNLTPLAPSGADRPFIDGIGSEVVVIFRKDSIEQFASSRDAGGSWSAPAKAIGAATFPAGNLRVITDATWVFPFFAEVSSGISVPTEESCAQRTVKVELGVTRDGGATWSSLDTGAQFSEIASQKTGGCAPGYVLPSLDADASGRWSVAWSQGSARGPSVWLARSSDAGASWSKASLVSPPGRSAIFPWIVQRGSHEVGVSYLVADKEGDPDVVPATWTAEVAWSSDDGATWTRSTLGIAHVGTICTGGGNCASADRSLGDLFQMARAPSGQVGVAWPADLEAPAKGTRIFLSLSS